MARPSTAKASTARPPAAPKAPPQLKVVKDALADMKAVDARVLDVRGLTDISDYMVVASGTSDRHVRSIADNVVRMARAAGVRPFGVEGAKDGEWVLVDLPDVMVHVMLPRVREFYGLEQLWEPPVARPAASAGSGVGAAKPRRSAGARAGRAAPREAKPAAARGAKGGARRRPPRAG
jgi:ribosome-associated protein